MALQKANVGGGYVTVRQIRAWYITNHIDLCVGVTHVADNAAVLHPVEVLSHHHILIAWWKEGNKTR